MKSEHIEKTSVGSDRNPLISIIVPVYNMEKLLCRCVDSILSQTYKDIEVILVDDCSTDMSAQIIEHYIDQDDRVKSVKHETNRGLFQARITGADIASGEYLAFVDSDDYISIDWFRKLIIKAEETMSDIVVGEWCFDHGGKHKEFLSLDPFRINDYLLEGDEILVRFMEQEGICFSWTVVWNKLYRRELWEKCVDDFKVFSCKHGHMLMWEDIAFSSGLWSNAMRVCNVHGIVYFYYQHDSASTAVTRNKKRNIKYIRDASAAMKLMETMLIKSGRMGEVADHYDQWVINAASLVYNELVVNLGLHYLEKQIRAAFSMYEPFVNNNTFFYQITTPLHESFFQWEAIKKEIVSCNTKVVSFDVFDTLIQRPLLRPTDLFCVLSDYYNRTTSSFVDFVRLRTEAEYNCRRKKELFSPSIEEITFDEIYEELENLTMFSKEKIDQIKRLEIETELKLCSARKSGKELFDLARAAEKKIVICSDMYLPKTTIQQILSICGYEGFEQIYVSSELMLTKAKGTLYRHIQKELRIKVPSEIIHVGDNMQSDVENARTEGWRSAHLCRAAEMFQNMNPDIYGGEGFSNVFFNNAGKEDFREAMNGFPALRCVFSLTANRFFDFPYVSISPASDFNADPNMIGYYVLGAHLLSLSEWIEKIAKERSIPTIHFVARDGFMVKIAFDLLNRTSTKSSYIRLSRKSLILGDVDSKDDLYSLYRKVNILQCTPKDLVEFLQPIIPSERSADSVRNQLAKQTLCFDRTFHSEEEYLRCMKVLIEEVIDFSLLGAYKEKLRKYFEEFIHPGDYIFDIGYSGRPEAALSNILGFSVGSLYVHINSDVAIKRQKRYDCPSESFYGFKPKITGVMREHLLMELGPSTIGYVEKNDTMEPIMEEYKEDYCSALMTRSMQNAAIDFIKDYINTFGGYRDQMALLSTPLSAPFEYYLHYSKAFDRKLFSTLLFEDSIGEGKAVKSLDFWNHEIIAKNLCVGNQTRGYANVSDEFSELYFDGLFVKMYRKLNKLFPLGSRKREFIKKIASVFIK